jgi:hypothetical protein
VIYPLEIYINGELSFSLQSEDATGDLVAIEALMAERCAGRENRPLTRQELHGDELQH